MTTKKCTKCPEGENIKPISEFYVCKGGVIRPSCKTCDNKMSRAYKARNKKHISEHNKEYKSENKEEISVYNHKYNIENREEIQKRQTKTRRIRRENDENFYQATTLRTKLCDFMRFGHNAKLIESLIGCDRHAFIIWLIFLFDDKMSMANHGQVWTIDHVNPCCNFDLSKEENQYVCFHWSNLRPMIKLNNSKKTGKIIADEIKAHEKLVKFFLKELPKEEKNNYSLLI
jgi:hypothetical protein